MRIAIFLIALSVVVFGAHKTYATSCLPVEKLSVLDIVLQNDVIFLGQRGTVVNDENKTTVYKVIAPLMGSLDGIVSFRLKQNVLIPDSTALDLSSFKADAHGSRMLFFAHYGANSDLIKTSYDICAQLPRQDVIISFLRGPYKYRYFILLLVAFVAFSIWRVGGPVNLLKADLKSILGAIFLINKPIKVSDNPSYFRKVVHRIRIPILMVGLFVLLVWINSYLWLYNFY